MQKKEQMNTAFIHSFFVLSRFVLVQECTKCFSFYLTY